MKTQNLIFLASFFLLFIVPIISQETLNINPKNFNDSNQILKDTTLAVKLLNQSIKHIKSSGYNYDECIQLTQKAEKLLLKHLDKEHLKIGDVYSWFGICYHRKNSLDTSEYYHNKALKIRLKYQETANVLVATSYLNLGHVNEKRGEYSRAIEYYRKALTTGLSKSGKINSRIGDTYNLLGNCYSSLGSYNEAEYYYHNAILVFTEVLPPRHKKIATVFSNLATVYRETKRYTQAEKLYAEALDIREKTLGKRHPGVAKIYKQKGILLIDIGKKKNAKKSFQKALKILRNSYGSFHPEIAKTYLSLAKVLKKEEKFKQGIGALEKALKSLNFKGMDSLNYVLSIPTLVETFQYKGKLHYSNYKTNNLKHELDESIHCFLNAIQVTFQLQQSFYENSDKKRVIGEAYPSFEGLIKAYLEAFENDSFESIFNKIFSISEQNKSLMLREALLTSNNPNFQNIPQELLEKKNRLIANIKELEIRQFKSQKKAGTIIEKDSIFNHYTAKIFDLKKTLKSVENTIYSSTKNGKNSIDLTQNLNYPNLRKNLLSSSNQALLEYFVGDDNIFIFLITKENVYIKHLQKDFPLENWIQEMRCGLFHIAVQDTTECGILNEETAKIQYADRANTLYEKIFAPIENHLKHEHIQEIILIPDGALGYVPFDALIKRKNANYDFQRHEYLTNYQFSYAYSAVLLNQITTNKLSKKPTKKLLAFAPIFEEIEQNTAPNDNLNINFFPEIYTRNQAGPLVNNIPEVQKIQQIIGGEIYTDTAATKANFLEKAPNHQILHLSTHGKANDKVGDYSYLVFYQTSDSTKTESLLYNRDLYQQSFNADMVVLSACETGIGELQRGEGIISLARGFSYAGAKSIVTTLWNVDDRSSSLLMEYFYKYLKKGMTKDAALKEAKYQLSLDPQYASPYYWAGVIPIGDMKAIEFNNEWNGQWHLLGFAGIGLFTFFLLHQRQVKME